MFRDKFNNKIGNTLVYLAERIRPLHLTKALKLLYIIDEKSVRETGVPFTWLEYKAWKNGPVAEDVYREIRFDDSHTMSGQILTVRDYINVHVDGSHFIITPKRIFIDDEFSDYDIELLDEVIRTYGNMTATRLIAMLHRKGSLWSDTVEKNGLEWFFDITSYRSDFVIPIINLLDTQEKKQAYQAAFESLDFESNMN